jgi:hypothetical protein
MSQALLEKQKPPKLSKICANKVKRGYKALALKILQGFNNSSMAKFAFKATLISRIHKCN